MAGREEAQQRLLSPCSYCWLLTLAFLPCPPAAGNTDAARLAYTGGIKRCLDSIPLWVAAARLEERAGNVAKARALLEQVSPGCWLRSCNASPAQLAVQAAD